MRTILFILLCWAALPPIAVAAPRPYHATRERRINLDDQPPKIRASMRRSRAVIYRVVLPDINVHAVSFRDAAELIRQGFREREPEHLGLSMFIKLRTGEPAPLVSLTLRSASTAEVLDALCAHGNYIWYVDSYTLAIAPAEDSAFIQRPHSR